MRKIWALVRARWLAASSYRLGFLLSFGSLVIGVVPLFFVADALQSTMANVIRGQGEQYFAFLVLGLIAINFVSSAMFALPSGLENATSTGTLEAMLATPTSVAALLLGLSGYEVIFAAIRGGAMLVASAAFGAQVEWTQLGATVPIVALLVLAHLPIAILTAAMVLAFRTRGPLPQLVLLLSTFLGGVYYPTTVIPGWLESVAAFIPLTYGLKALRVVLLEGQPIVTVWRELSILAVFSVAGFAVSAVAFRAALRYARRVGNLAQY